MQIICLCQRTIKPYDGFFSRKNGDHHGDEHDDTMERAAEVNRVTEGEVDCVKNHELGAKQHQPGEEHTKKEETCSTPRFCL